jgi:AAA+ superfamily predicted ATPase
MILLLLLITSISCSAYTNTAHDPLLNKNVYYQNLHLKQELIQPSTENPLPVRIDLGEGGGDMVEQFNENFKEYIGPELKKTFQLMFGTLLNNENAIRFGWPIALFSIVGISGFYGSRIFWKVLEKNLLSPKPTILQPGSKYGWIDRWKRSRIGYITPPMVFDTTVKERLEEIKEKTKNIRHQILSGNKITYDNLLLYGKPGTGKTLFAQILADETDMDFLSITAASLLQSGIEGIKYFDEIAEMARKSKYGVILFIDEADALFINRDLLNPESDHYKVLNHILAATGNGSDKMMLIAATNHAHIMDPAMGRRFQERIKMPLPNEQTRKALFDLYINQYLFNNTQNSFQFVQTARSIITPAYIDMMVQQTIGLSHAEIKDMIVIMSKKAHASKQGILNEHHVQSAVNQAIEKMNALKKDKAKLKKKQNKTE